MKVQTEANHDSLLGEFDELMTNPGEVKAVLEQHFDPCSSNMLLTSIFQVHNYNVIYIYINIIQYHDTITYRVYAQRMQLQN